MFSFLKRFFAAKVHSVDTIMSNFTSTVKRLEDAATHHASLAKFHDEAAALALQAKRTAQLEASRAANIKSRLLVLVSDDDTAFKPASA